MKSRSRFAGPALLVLLLGGAGAYSLVTRLSRGPALQLSQPAAATAPESAAANDAAPGEPAFPLPDNSDAATPADATVPASAGAMTPATSAGGTASAGTGTAPALGKGPAAAKEFDPRFVQPATRLKLFGEEGAERERLFRESEAASLAEKAAAIAWARARGWPISDTTRDGVKFELMRMGANGLPVYYQTNNEEARVSHNVEPLTQFGGPPGGVTINLSGSGWKAGMWEEGSPRLSHQEFNDFPGRVVYADTGVDANRPADSHATHVMGTILGNGVVDGNARGMAWRASALCFGWNNDNGELTSNGAGAPDQPSRVYVSNHSYGYILGWSRYGSTHARAGGWYWQGTNGQAEAEGFGNYDSGCRSIDTACRRTPYLLPFFAAGNDRGQEPSLLSTVYFMRPDGNGGWEETSGTWPFVSGAPGADGSAENGYDTLSSKGQAKNAMCVGNMQDAVSGGARSPGGVAMVSSSGYGPTDDGRIKPDVVANGHNVLSAEFNSDTATASKTGTSMASPGACGTGLLLHEHYRDKTGQYLRGSSLKALMIHTATDVQDAGPDYKSGWGLIDAVAAVNHIDLHAAEPGGSHVVEGVLSAEQPEFRISFTASGPVKATLCWTDPEGTAQSGLDDRTKVLVNDLDLYIYPPGGGLPYLAPELNPANPAAAAVYDGNDTDNVEVVGGFPLQLIPPFPGVYELAVTFKGSITEPGVTDPAKRKQVFSLMLHGNAAASTGTVAEGADKPERSFVRNRDSTAGFGYETAAGATGGDRAMNLDIGDNEKAGSETNVIGPVTVTFNWGVDSEATYDFLRFYSNNVKIAEISGSVAGAPITYNVPVGLHTLRWSYEKDVSISTGADKGWFDNLEFNSLPEAVDNPALTFTHPAGSTAFWTLENTTGNPGTPTNDVAKAGDITAGQRSDMETIIQGPALVRFRMVHNAAAGVGEMRAHWGPGSNSLLHTAGNVWRTYSIELAAGPQTVRWSWTKTANGSGAGRVDELTVTPLPASLREAADLPGSASNLVVEDFANAPWIADASDAAPSGRLGERGPHSIHTIYTPGANNDTAIRYPITSNLGGTVSFWWQASGATAGTMSLQLRTSSTGAFVLAGPDVGPRKINAIPGGTGWQQVHLEIPAGYVELRFFYDATSTAGQGWLDQIEFQEGLMHPARGLDRWGSRWETFGDAPWAGVHDTTNNGVDSTSHGDIGDNQSTSLTTVVTGPKFLRFHWKVDSEANYDFLRFHLDGEEAVPALSGQGGGWKEVTLNIAAGTHVLRWSYNKDVSVSTGQDRGWVDQIAILRPDFGVGALTFFANGAGAIVPAYKDATSGFFLETSTDLVTWVQAGSGGMLPPRFTDVNVIVNSPGNRRFFRLQYFPEMVHTIENAGFELPAAAPNTLSANGPGWGPDNDGANVSSFEHIPGFAAEGTQHLSLAAGAFSEMKGSFRGYRGVHSVSVAVGHRSGFTQPGNLSSIVLTSGPELARTALGAAGFPAGTWQRPMPVSYDSFVTDLDDFLDYKVRLEGTVSRSHFDAVRVVSEPQ